MKLKTFIIEYTKPFDRRVWKTEVLNTDRELAVKKFEKAFYGLKVHKCYLREES